MQCRFGKFSEVQYSKEQFGAAHSLQLNAVHYRGLHCGNMSGKKKGQSVTNIVGYEIKDERDAKNLSCICCPNWRKTLGATVHIGLPLNISLFIFTNSAPLGRVGHRVAMSVCVCVCAIAKHPLPEVV